MSLNGTHTKLPPEDDFSRKKAILDRYDEETASRRLSHEAKLAQDIEEREQCMKHASDHAGAIGLVYDAVGNNYYRIASEIEQPEEPAMPEPPAPPALSPTPRMKDVVRQGNGKTSKWLDGISWVLSIPIGIFVGYGLVTLTGLPIQRQPIYMWAGCLIGVAAILALKLLFDRLWRHVGKEKAMGHPIVGLVLFSGALTLALTMVEAWLGAQALVIYSHRVAFDEKDALQLGTAFPLAIAISTATLLLSAVAGYIKGTETLSEHDEEIREYEFLTRQNEKENERRQAQHREEIRRWEEQKQALNTQHQDQLTRMDAEKEEMDNYRKSADFQALLKYIGRINSLNVIIEEQEAKMKSDRISRGYEKAVISK